MVPVVVEVVVEVEDEPRPEELDDAAAEEEEEEPLPPAVEDRLKKEAAPDRVFPPPPVDAMGWVRKVWGVGGVSVVVSRVLNWGEGSESVCSKRWSRTKPP